MTSVQLPDSHTKTDNKENLVCIAKEAKSTVKKRAKSSEENQCDKCGKIYVNRCHLLRHMRSHGQESLGVFSCGLCDLSSHRRDVIAKHVNRCHVGEATFACDQCDRSFFELFDLRRHRISVHPDSNAKPFVCETCQAGFSQKSSLTAHLKCHKAGSATPVSSRRGRFPCPECGREFTRHHTMMRHARVHSDRMHLKKPFQCRHCRMRFARRFNAGLHESNCRP